MIIQRAITESIDAKKALLASQEILTLIQKTADECLQALQQNKKIILCQKKQYLLLQSDHALQIDRMQQFVQLDLLFLAQVFHQSKT